MSRLLGWTSKNAGHEGAIPCPRTVAYPLNIEWRDSAKSVKRRGKSDGASSVLLCCTHSYFCICLVVPYVSLMLYVFEDD